MAKTRKDLDQAAGTLARRMYHTVLPIIGADERGRHDAIGSGILIAFGTRRFLATAAHVLEHNDENGSTNPLWKATTLYLGNPGNPHVRLLGDAPKATDPADVALVELGDETLAGLENCHFLNADHDFAAASTSSNFAVAIGYQNRASKPNEDLKTVKHEPLIFSNSGSHRKGIHIYLPMDWTKVRDGDLIRSIGKLNGISGGGLFWLRTLTDPESCDPLAGIIIEHANKTLKATDVHLLRHLIA